MAYAADRGALPRQVAEAGMDGEAARRRSERGNSKQRISQRVSPPTGSTESRSASRNGKFKRLWRLSRNPNSADRTSTSSSSNGQYVALYDYIAQNNDELTLVRGKDVEILTKDKRVCGDKNWWMGRSIGQTGIFPSSYVVEKTDLDRVNILLPLEIDFEELTQKALIGRGGFGKVYLCTWRGEEVRITHTTRSCENTCHLVTVHGDTMPTTFSFLESSMTTTV